ncbi:MAG: class I SAM-dependent methyltransferase [Candidatus Methanoperedens sp.]|nr:class I SAM-dependent methyltransferase [Candidatus Methanoperedens sp.]
MDIEKFYDEYWTNIGDTVDHDRLNMIVRRIEPGEKVLEINCGLSILAEKIAKKGADITVTDLSSVALERARSRGLQKRFKVDIDTQPLPVSFESSKFDTIVSSSMIEHCFFPENTLREGAKVLKDGGKFYAMVSNIGHWRFRLWLLFGRFPYLEGTPTDMLHLRFLTVHSLKESGKKYGLEAKKVEGHPGLWAGSLYSWLFTVRPIKQVYELLTMVYPSLFSRYMLITFEKKKELKM